MFKTLRHWLTDTCDAKKTQHNKHKTYIINMKYIHFNPHLILQCAGTHLLPHNDALPVITAYEHIPLGENAFFVNIYQTNNFQRDMIQATKQQMYDHF